MNRVEYLNVDHTCSTACQASLRGLYEHNHFSGCECKARSKGIAHARVIGKVVALDIRNRRVVQNMIKPFSVIYIYTCIRQKIY